MVIIYSDNQDLSMSCHSHILASDSPDLLHGERVQLITGQLAISVYNFLSSHTKRGLLISEAYSLYLVYIDYGYVKRSL